MRIFQWAPNNGLQRISLQTEYIRMFKMMFVTKKREIGNHLEGFKFVENLCVFVPQCFKNSKKIETIPYLKF